jgi:DNA-binding transcriptional LysR family regulator
MFARVVQQGTFTGAAQFEDLTTAYVSRAVSSLEAHLRTRLLHRTTRRVTLTPAGERFHERCLTILQELDAAEAEARDATIHATGKLHIHAPPQFALHYLMPVVTTYRRNFPNVEIELTLSPNSPDIQREGFDIALILATELPDSGLVSSRLGSTYGIACASQEYVAAHGAPAAPVDLLQHDCLRLQWASYASDTWTYDGPDGHESIDVSGSFTVNTTESMMAAMRAGMGIAVLPIYAALEGLRDGKIIRVLPEYRFHKLNIYQVHMSRHFVDATITNWVRHIREVLEDKLRQDELAIDQLTQRA